MGGGQVIHVVRLAAGGFTSLEGGAVPGGLSYLVSLRGFWRLMYGFLASNCGTGNRIVGFGVACGCCSHGGGEKTSRQEVGQYSFHYTPLAIVRMVPP